MGVTHHLRHQIGVHSRRCWEHIVYLRAKRARLLKPGLCFAKVPEVLRDISRFSDHESHQSPGREAVPEVMKPQRRVVRYGSHFFVNDGKQPTRRELEPLTAGDRKQSQAAVIWLLLSPLSQVQELLTLL